MKKFTIILLVVGLCLLSGNAFAEDLAPAGAVSTIKGGNLTGGVGTDTSINIAKMSTNVVIGVMYNSDAYALSTYHTSGTKAYGTAFDSTALFWKELGVGGTLTAPASSNNEDAFTGEGWTKM